jgi:hypothetical protein
LALPVAGDDHDTTLGYVPPALVQDFAGFGLGSENPCPAHAQTAA